MICTGGSVWGVTVDTVREGVVFVVMTVDLVSTKIGIG